MKARIPKHREFIINFPDSIPEAKANEGWAKLQQIVEDYKKAHNGASVYAPTFIEDLSLIHIFPASLPPPVQKIALTVMFHRGLTHSLFCITLN